MKKKGLIISSIVMVVVLIASLTTATYAWFNASSEVKVNDVTVSVASATNISIGIASTKNADRKKATSYVNDEITYNEPTPAGLGGGTFSGKAGLGTSVKWNWVLSSIGGVSSSANGTSFDTSYSLSNALYNGTVHTEVVEGVTTTTYPPTGIAKFNGSTNQGENANTVIYAPFGLRVEKENLNYLYCDITITPSAEFWGIIAALKLEITTSDGTTQQYHPFALSSGDGLLETAITYESEPGKEVSASYTVPSSVTFRFIIDKNEATPLLYNGQTGAQIYRFDVRMFLDGEDANCIADATQYGAIVGIAFNADTTANYTSSATGKVVTDLSSHKTYPGA